MDLFAHAHLLVLENDVNVGVDPDLRYELFEITFRLDLRKLTGGDAHDLDVGPAPCSVLREQVGKKKHKVSVSLQSSPPDMDRTLDPLSRKEVARLNPSDDHGCIEALEAMHGT